MVHLQVFPENKGKENAHECALGLKGFVYFNLGEITKK